MPRFKRKASAKTIEAIQYMPGVEHPGIYPDNMYATLRHYVVTTHGQPVYLKPSDWIVPEPDGKGYYPVKPDIFANTWELDEPKKPLSAMTKQELSDLMVASIKAVQDVTGPESQLCLLVFDDPHSAQYISNCTRETMILALRETADRLEKRQDTPR